MRNEFVDRSGTSPGIKYPTLFQRLIYRFEPTRTIQYALLIFFLLLSFFVIVIMFSMSLRPTVLIYTDFWGLPFPPTFANYQNAFGQLIKPIVRTMLIGFTSIAGIVFFACPASYAISRIRFPGKQIVFLAVLALIIIPGPIMLAPNFILANQLGLRGTLQGLIVFYVAGGQPFAIFLISTYFLNQEAEIFEAARMDGASEIQALIRVAVPLAWPIIMTVGILNFLGIYSDLIWPSLMLSKADQTLMMALQNFDALEGQFSSRPDWGVRSAGYSIAVLPQLILFTLAMKYFIQGLTSGAVKG